MMGMSFIITILDTTRLIIIRGLIFPWTEKKQVDDAEIAKILRGATDKVEIKEDLIEFESGYAHEEDIHGDLGRKIFRGFVLPTPGQAVYVCAVEILPDVQRPDSVLEVWALVSRRQDLNTGVCFNHAAYHSCEDDEGEFQPHSNYCCSGWCNIAHLIIDPYQQKDTSITNMQKYFSCERSYDYYTKKAKRKSELEHIMKWQSIDLLARRLSERQWVWLARRSIVRMKLNRRKQWLHTIALNRRQRQYFVE